MGKRDLERVEDFYRSLARIFPQRATNIIKKPAEFQTGGHKVRATTQAYQIDAAPPSQQRDVHGRAHGIEGLLRQLFEEAASDE